MVEYYRYDGFLYLSLDSMRTKIVLCFETDKFGEVRVGAVYNNKDEYFYLDECYGEPDLDAFSDDEIDYMRTVGIAVCGVIFKSDKLPERVRVNPKDLYTVAS